MDRRGFLKTIIGSAVALSIPAIANSQAKQPAKLMPYQEQIWKWIQTSDQRTKQVCRDPGGQIRGTGERGYSVIGEIGPELHTPIDEYTTPELSAMDQKNMPEWVAKLNPRRRIL